MRPVAEAVLPKVLVVVCVVAVLITHAVAALNSHGFYHPDEHFQILEFLMTKLPVRAAGQMPALPWEYATQIRPWLQIAWYWLFAYPMALAGYDEGWRIVLVLRLVNAGLGLFALYCLMRASEIMFKERWRRTVILVMLCTMFYVPYLHVRTSSENYGGLFTVFAVCLYLLKLDKRQQVDRHARMLAVAVGVLWGIAFHCRFQMAMGLIGFGLWLLVMRRLSWTLIAWMAAGFVTTEGASVVIDYWGYGNWVWTPLTYFKVNILEGKAKEFGVSPWSAWWSFYLKDMAQPFGGMVFLGGLVSLVLNRRNLLAWVCVSFLVGQWFIAHKEDRFFFPLADLMVPLYASLFCWVEGFSRRKWVGLKPLIVAVVSMFLAVDAVGLVVMSTRSDPWNIPQLEYLERAYLQGGPRTVYYTHYDPFTTGNVIPIDFYANRSRFKVEELKDFKDILAHESNQPVFLFTNESGCPNGADEILAERGCTLLLRTPQILRWWQRHKHFCRWFGPTVRYDLYTCKTPFVGPPA